MVLVLDRARVLGQSVAAALSHHGIEARYIEEFTSNGAPLHAPLLVRTSGLRDVQAVSEVGGEGLSITVILDEPHHLVVASYLKAGAQHVLPHTSSLHVLVSVLRDPIESGITLIPSECAMEMSTAGSGEAGVYGGLAQDEIGWIREIAQGQKVHEIADRAGYSERSMFRRLDRIYRLLGVSGRTEAIVAARRIGYL